MSQREGEPADGDGHVGPDSADRDTIVCLECGRRMRALGAHLWRVHGITGEEYRRWHGLPAGARLVAESLAERYAEGTRSRFDAGEITPIRQRLTSEQQRAASRMGAEVHRESARRGVVRHAHQRGVSAARDAAHERARARLETRAQTLGYESWQALVVATAAWAPREVAALVGRDDTTVVYWRRRLLGRDYVQGRVDPRRARRFAELAEALRVRGWVTVDEALADPDGPSSVWALARELGAGYNTIRALRDAQRAGNTY